ncbi:MAG: peptidase [Ilumatobacteraceae bacterium]
MRTNDGRSLTRRVATFVAAVLTLGVALAPAPSSPAAATVPPEPTPAVGIRILDAPTDRADDPRARTYIVDHLAPGTTITRRIEVTNSTPDVQAVEVYPAAAIVGDGGFQPVEGRTVNELSSWTTLDTAMVSPPPGESSVVTVTITVPADAAPGERYAAIWAQLPTAVSTSGGISAINRVGIRVYLSVGEGNEPASDFTIETFEATRDADGVPSVAAIVNNTGGRALDLTGEMTLSNGPGGISAGPFPATLGTTIEVGGSAPAVIILDEAIPAGTWDAHIALRSGMLTREADAQIEIPTAAEVAAPPVVADEVEDGSSRLVPVLVGCGILLLAAIVAMWFLRRRRRAARSRSSDPVAAGSGPNVRAGKAEPVAGRSR